MSESASNGPLRLLAAFEKFISLTGSEQATLAGMFHPRRVLRREFLLQRGDICRHEHFVLNGSFRSFLVDENGEEHTLHFAIENWWITDLSSFIKEEPSILYIQALEPSVVLQISRPALEDLYNTVPQTERFFRILHENAYIAQNRRILNNIALQGKPRYENFVQQYPAFVQRIPQKYIASYLGMTPVFLSKIKGTKDVG